MFRFIDDFLWAVLVEIFTSSINRNNFLFASFHLQLQHVPFLPSVAGLSASAFPSFDFLASFSAGLSLSVLSVFDSLESISLASSAFYWQFSFSAEVGVTTSALSLGVGLTSSCGFSSVFGRLATLSVAGVSVSTVLELLVEALL